MSIAKDLGWKYANVKNRVEKMKGNIQYNNVPKEKQDYMLSCMIYIASRAYAEGYRQASKCDVITGFSEKEALQYAIKVLQEKKKGDA